MKIVGTIGLLACFLPTAVAQVAASNVNAHAPAPGIAAPVLEFNHLLQAPEGTKADWRTLHGKVVVLEFWATWCAPCIAEIPVLNALQASLDPAKVQFISIDDEDPALVAAFLKKRPIGGWVGLDTSARVFERFGVDGRPATMVIDTNGRVVTATVHPEMLGREQLLAIADGHAVNFSERANVAVDAATVDRRNLELKRAFSAQGMVMPSTEGSELEVNVTAGDETDGHIMNRGFGEVDLTNVPVKLLVSFGLGVGSGRIVSQGALPKGNYNLHVNAPKADPKRLADAVAAAITSSTGVRIERHTETVDAYVLTATDGAQVHFQKWPYPGGAMFNPQNGTLMSIHATADQLAAALEQALKTPVVNETGLSGALMMNFKVGSKDFAAANAALESAVSLTLVPAKRAIETVILSAAN